MLASTKDILEKAREGEYAVGQLNINNLEWTKSVLLTAEELKSSVIPGASKGTGKYMTGFKTVVAMAEAMMKELNITVPVALHLDHGTHDGCYKRIKAGFSSTMFDSSYYPIEGNTEKAKELVKVVHAMGLSLRAEVGSIGGKGDSVASLDECVDSQKHEAIADLGIDFLAADIDNICNRHLGDWPSLRFDALERVKAVTGDMPLILHDGTGIPKDMIKETISLGVIKVSVNTECQLSFTAATREYVEADEDLKGKGFDPRKLLAPGTDIIRATVKEKMELFGSVGKA